MAFLAIIAGLLPIMRSGGTGADMMKRIAAPMVVGVVTSFILEQYEGEGLRNLKFRSCRS